MKKGREDTNDLECWQGGGAPCPWSEPRHCHPHLVLTDTPMARLQGTSWAKGGWGPGSRRLVNCLWRLNASLKNSTAVCDIPLGWRAPSNSQPLVLQYLWGHAAVTAAFCFPTSYSFLSSRIDVMSKRLTAFHRLCIYDALLKQGNDLVADRWELSELPLHSPSAQPVWLQSRRVSLQLCTGVFCTWSKCVSQLCCRDQAACG